MSCHFDELPLHRLVTTSELERGRNRGIDRDRKGEREREFNTQKRKNRESFLIYENERDWKKLALKVRKRGL
jgi:hypothetical protein